MLCYNTAVAAARPLLAYMSSYTHIRVYSCLEHVPRVCRSRYESTDKEPPKGFFDAAITRHIFLAKYVHHLRAMYGPCARVLFGDACAAVVAMSFMSSTVCRVPDICALWCVGVLCFGVRRVVASLE